MSRATGLSAANPGDPGIRDIGNRCGSKDFRDRMKKNIFVVGYDDFNRTKLEPLAEPYGYTFHTLLHAEEAEAQAHLPFDDLFALAKERLDAFKGPIDAIIGFWDFPTMALVAALCEEYGLTGPPLQSVVNCEHKYWSRLSQRDVIPANVPGFCAVNPFDENALSHLTIDFPFWLKPVKSFSSYLGFHVRDEAEFHAALAQIREGIERISVPFNQLLRHVKLPPEVQGIDGNWCIAEEIIGGRQCTLEGYVYRGKVEVYGVVDSIRFPRMSSFQRYQYPSRLPRAVQRRMMELSKRVLKAVGFDDSAFNIEFFYEPKRNKVWLLEINTRMSQSHGDLFEKVDGTPHHRLAVELALGNRPEWQHGAGPFGCAAKLYMRRFRDGRVKRAPTAEEIAAVQERFPGTLVELTVREGMRLSDQSSQDSYSYELANIFMGARNQPELLANYREVRRGLPFRFTS